MKSYLRDSDADLGKALALYDWNSRATGALHEDIGRLEVVFRNSLDRALTSLSRDRSWATEWYLRADLFRGKHGRRAREDIETARHRAKRGGVPKTHGKIITELNFGFWRFLCSKSYLTSLWVPSLAGAFPDHPNAENPRKVRSEVEDRMQRIHFLRNRVAHHEPIHQRNLERDLQNIIEVVSWISEDAMFWVTESSRTSDVLTTLP